MAENTYSNVAIPPGATLQEVLEYTGMSQASLARRMDRPLNRINEIIKGKSAITPDTAIQLERVLGMPAEFWNNLEKRYQETLARIRADADLANQTEHVKQFPYAEMARWGWVKRTRSAREKVVELLRFFSVSSLDLVPDLYEAAFRVGKSEKCSRHALAAWLRQGEIEASQIDTEPFDEARLRALLPTLRAMTNKSDPRVFLPEVRELCRSVGVAFVVVPHLRKTYANGAARWMGQKALIQLSIRYRWEDVFWFTFFHELAHVVLHRKRFVYVDTAESAVTHTAEEEEANRFAADTLLPPDRFKAFTRRGMFSPSAVKTFADEVSVSPAIVVGRLQYERWIQPNHLQGLRGRFKWSHEDR